MPGDQRAQPVVALVLVVAPVPEHIDLQHVFIEDGDRIVLPARCAGVAPLNPDAGRRPPRRVQRLRTDR